MNIKILVVTHKKYKMPEDSIYLPVQVGSSGKSLGFQRDNEGENIAEKNARLCELTAMYWAWKNLKADYIGLTHYRRHFTEWDRWQRMFHRDKFSMVLEEEDLKRELKSADVIVPNKRRYFIETMESHFLHLPYTFEKDYKVLREVIGEKTPEYVKAYDKVMNRTWAHMFNMFIMKKELFDRYCDWMFPVIFECDRRIDVTGYTPMEARTVAYFGEFMLDIWMTKNHISYKEMDVMFMERQNWIKKGGGFVMRKFIGKEA